MNAEAKRYVRIRLPPEIKPVCILELLFVAVGRHECCEHQFSTRNRDPGNSRVLPSEAFCGGFERPRVAQQFLDCRFDYVGSFLSLSSWSGFSSNVSVPLPRR